MTNSTAIQHNLRRLLVSLVVACFVLLVGLTPTWSAEARKHDHVEIGVTVPPSGQAGEGAVELSNASLRWGINVETNSGAYYGGCNFLSAGITPDMGSSRVWSDADRDKAYKVSEGNTRIEKIDGKGGWMPASWETRCQDYSGRAVGVTPQEPGSGTVVVIDSGTGHADPKTNTASIDWEGSFTVVFYGGMTYWSATDPQLRIENGNGVLTVQVSGYGAAMYDSSKWVSLESRRVAIATLRGVDVEEDKIVHVPEYEGVAINVAAQGPSAPQIRDEEGWGAFPQDFIDFQVETGQAGYWYSSGGQRDVAKPPSTMYINYDASAVVQSQTPQPPPPGVDQPAGPGGIAPQFPAGQPVVSQPVNSGGFPDYGPVATTAGNTNFEPLDLSALLNSPANPAVENAELTRFGTPIEAQDIDWLGGGLVPAMVDLVSNHREAFLYSLAGLMALGALTGLAYYKGWLVLPWKRKIATTE